MEKLPEKLFDWLFAQHPKIGLLALPSVLWIFKAPDVLRAYGIFTWQGFVGVTAALTLIYLPFYFFIIEKLIFTVRPHNLLINITCDTEKSEQNTTKVINLLKFKLSAFHFISRKTKIRQLRYLVINEIHQAHRLVEKRHADLVVWGTATTASENGKELTKYSLQFTANLYPVNRTISTVDLSNLALIVKGRSWQISGENEHTTIETTSSGLFVSLLMPVGVFYFKSRKFADAITIFQHIQDEIRENPPVDAAIATALDDRTKHYIVTCCVEIMSSLAQSKKVADLHTIVQYADLLHSTGIDEYTACIGKARALYLLGKVDQARDCSERALELNSHGECAILNKAFFSILDGDYQSAADHYHSLNSCHLDCGNPLNVIEFFEDELTRRNSDEAMCFCLGYLQVKYADTEYGKSILKKFISDLSDNKKYLPLIRVAKAVCHMKDQKPKVPVRRKLTRAERRREKKKLQNKGKSIIQDTPE